MTLPTHWTYSLHFLWISSFSVHFLILCPFPHSLSISSFSVHFLILCPFPYSLSISSQPGCKAATTCAALGMAIYGGTGKSSLAWVGRPSSGRHWSTLSGHIPTGTLSSLAEKNFCIRRKKTSYVHISRGTKKFLDNFQLLQGSYLLFTVIKWAHIF